MGGGGGIGGEGQIGVNECEGGVVVGGGRGVRGRVSGVGGEGRGMWVIVHASVEGEGRLSCMECGVGGGGCCLMGEAGGGGGGGL